MIPDTYHFGEEVYYLISNQFQGNPLRKKTFDIVWQDADDVAEVKVHTNDIGDVHENI